MRESQIETYFVRTVKRMGGQVRKVTWQGHRGAPDRKVMHPQFGCWVELKAPGEQLKAHQFREIATMRAMGETVYVFDSKEQIDKWALVYTKAKDVKTPAASLFFELGF